MKEWILIIQIESITLNEIMNEQIKFATKKTLVLNTNF